MNYKDTLPDTTRKQGKITCVHLTNYNNSWSTANATKMSKFQNDN